MVSKFFSVCFFLLAKKVGSPELAIQQVPLKTPPKYRKQTPLKKKKKKKNPQKKKKT